MSIFTIDNPLLNVAEWDYTGSPVDKSAKEGFRLDGVFSGIALTLRTNCSTAAPFTLVVDGGSPTTPTISTNTYVDLPVFTGLPDTAHTVTITINGGSADRFIKGASAFTLAGSSPALSRASGYARSYNLREAHAFLDRTPWGSSVSVNDAIYENGSCASIRFRGTSGNDYKLSVIIQGGLCFTSDIMVVAGKVWIYTSQGGATFNLAVNGVEQAGTVTLITGDAWAWVQVADTGLSETIDETFTQPTRRSCYCEGDSITDAATTPGPDARVGYPYKYGFLTDTQLQGKGTPGGATPSGCGILASQNPDEITSLWGTGDVANGTDLTVLTATVESWILSARTTSPGSRITWLGILDRSTLTGSLPSYRAAIAAGVANYLINHPSDTNVRHVPTIGWIDPNTGSDTIDGLHPSATGAAKIANHLVPVLATSSNRSLTVSGTTGTVTVTMRAGGTFSGNQKITLSTSAGNITATAAGGTITNNVTGTVDVTPVSGSTSLAYTSSATATITYTTDQVGWTMPGTTNYTAPSGGAQFNPATIISTSPNRMSLRSTIFRPFDPISVNIISDQQSSGIHSVRSNIDRRTKTYW